MAAEAARRVRLLILNRLAGHHRRGAPGGSRLKKNVDGRERRQHWTCGGTK